ncbi:putative phage tail assembly chaperone [Pseudomonas sp. CCI4.2]|uniref:putative phage tail assembly chaperone n=1 Tax=Pseudomonas sp. CCI4.2 TaxID=3048620 RepID=UPI002AC935F9|nr:putative phage tail assembly chaperone [Pseudomonas sp. CCI4.2]MEB0090071.1 putative phage tail assembly chaperone [Pseudomonas sp. CCI4.2]WPX53465.1 putative phage tail assembly chaperone [Pseudomonas sp. CCI4.2]
MTDKRDITLSIGDTDFTFTLAPADVTKYFNAVTPNNKVAPSNNLLTNTVIAEHLGALRPLLRNPVLTMQLAGTLLEEYAPDVEIVVKKPSTAPSV